MTQRNLVNVVNIDCVSISSWFFFFFFFSRWSQGYEGQELCYIKNDICYLIGRNVTLLNENGTQKVFQFSGKAIGPFAVHTINETFALGEHCIDPKIYIYSYPDFEERNILIGMYAHVLQSDLTPFKYVYGVLIHVP